MATIDSIRAKLGVASPKLEASQCQILKPGDYQFVILEAREEHDDTRGYDYWYFRLDCGGKLTTDRFPLVENMLWKLINLLAAVRVEIDDLIDVKELAGRTGEFTAEAKGSQTFYKYQPKNG